MRKISAHCAYIKPNIILKKPIICLNNSNIIIDIIDTSGIITEESSLEFYNGILIPNIFYGNTANLLTTFAQLKQIAQNSPEISFNQLMQIACNMGSKSLCEQNCFNTLEIGKLPEIYLIENANLLNLQITTQSTIKRLV